MDIGDWEESEGNQVFQKIQQILKATDRWGSGDHALHENDSCEISERNHYYYVPRSANISAKAGRAINHCLHRIIVSQ